MKKQISEISSMESKNQRKDRIEITLAQTSELVEKITHPNVTPSDLTDVINRDLDFGSMNSFEVQTLLESLTSIRSGRSANLTLAERILFRTSMKRIEDDEENYQPTQNGVPNESRPKLH